MNAVRNMSAARTLLLVLALATAAALAGCGVSTEKVPSERGAELAAGEAASPAALSDRPPATVLAQGSTLDAVTPLADGPFQTATSNRVRFESASGKDALAALCSGEVDVVELGEAVTPAEAKACGRNHLDLVGPLLIGSDAAVIATKNETDVGGDCLTVGQLRDVFRAGSPYTNWSQLGFYDVPLHATGSLSEPVLDELFANRVLGSEGPLQRSELRGDFLTTPRAEATRLQVTAAGDLARAHALARRRAAALRDEVAAQRQRLVEAAEARADRRVLHKIEAVNARNRRLKVSVDAEALIRHNAEMSAAAKLAAGRRAGARFDARLAPRILRLNSDLLARARTPGVVGFVRFTFYEQWEEQLRPVEVWANDGAKSSAQEPNCVFPSAQTVSSGHYPLALQVLAYTTRQALARAAVRQYLLYLIGNAQRLTAKAGLVPITTQQRDADLLAIGVQPPQSAPAEAPPIETAPSRAATPPSPAPEAEAVEPSGIPGVGSGVTTP
jgi:ABC-type phosphate transport system substrate-binding protein